MLTGVFFIIALLIMSVLIKLAEVSIGDVSEAELEPFFQRSKKSAKRVAKLSENPFPFASSLKTALSFHEFTALTTAALTFGPMISEPLEKAGLKAMLAEIIAVLAIALAAVLTYVIFVAIVARHVAIKHSLTVSLRLSLFAYVISKIFLPLSALISCVAGAILKLFGINRHEQESDVSEEAIKMLVDAGTEMGAIDTEEKEFIENVFAFNDLSADEISTHRTGITILWTSETDAEWEKTVYGSHHTYFPVCDGKIDNVVGILNAKEYLRLKNKKRDEVMKLAVKAPYFIPETMKANDILSNMKKRREYFAVVIDEYGGLSGIVTVSDLLQCIVGDIFEDENEPKRPEIERLDSKVWMILGSAPIDDVEEALGVTLDGDYDTFAGYVLTMIVGSIPDDGATLNVENDIMSVRITGFKDHRIEKTMVQLKEQKYDE